jgi:YHS domain-containing protein
MTTHSLRIAVALTLASVPGVTLAQHEAHQAGAGQASTEMGQCARVQPVVHSIIAVATARLESARQSNTPAAMRAAVDQLEAALRDIRTQLAPCSASGTGGLPGGHVVPGIEPAAGGAAPAPPMDHSKMPMVDTSTVARPGKVIDPVNGLMVDPATAVQTTFEGRTYFFSSTQTRSEFLANPTRFAKKPKG